MSEAAAFDINLALNSMYIVGTITSWACEYPLLVQITRLTISFVPIRSTECLHCRSGIHGRDPWCYWYFGILPQQLWSGLRYWLIIDSSKLWLQHFRRTTL